jgi:PAS domain S-box-containing protein
MSGLLSQHMPRFDAGRFAFETGRLVAIAAVYFVLAKAGLALASIHPSASPVWPPSGFALAAVLLWGIRAWPAVFGAALLANLTTAGTLATSLGIAVGNTLEALIGGFLIDRFCGGRDVFETPARIAKFYLLTLAPGTMISATLGVGSLYVAGYAEQSHIGALWITWWLGDVGGQILLTPVLVLWAHPSPALPKQRDGREFALLMAGTGAVGLVAFSPLMEQTATRGSLAFFAVVPLLWAALRRGQRDTATVALVLSCFAIWGTLDNGGPFARQTLNESFLLVLTFVIGSAVPSLVLSADVAVRMRTEQKLRKAHSEVDEKVRVRTAALAEANSALQAEVQHRERVEAERERQRLHLLEAQGLANLGSWTWDIAEGKVTWSEQLYNIYGIRPGTFGGTFEDFLARIHEDDRERVKKGVSEAFQSGQGFRMEERIVRPDGEIRHLLSSGKVIKDESGRVVQMLGICQDITDQKKAELALAQTRDQLAQAQKLEALGQLTGGIAHDFNNILMIVSGQAQLLRRRISDPKQLQALDAIATAASRGETLTRQLLAFSRRQKLSPVTIDLHQRIESVRTMLISSLRGDIDFRCELAPDLWPVTLDLSELELALVNLAVNARDAMPHGGRVTLSARNATLDGKPERGGLKGDYVALAMTDTGVGIPPEAIPKIFDPFFTTKPVGKGTGLGLSQVYGFAHQAGGTVTVESSLGRGTTITVYLPRSREPLPQSAEETTAPPAVNARTATILLVEDNSDVADVTTSLLDQLGYLVLHARDAAEALAILERGERVALVFTDIVMPGGMNGLELARVVRERYRTVPVLLTSGYSDSANSAEREFPILRKPYELANLDGAIRSLLANLTPESAAPSAEPSPARNARA